MRVYITLSSKCLKDNMRVFIDDITFYASDSFKVDDVVVAACDENGGCVHLNFGEQDFVIDGDEVTVRLKVCMPWIEDDRQPNHFDEALIEDKLESGMFDVVCPYVTIHDQEVTIEDFKITSLVVHANGNKFEPSIGKMTVEV